MPSRYEWQRFWCSREGSVNLGDGGYLVDPTSRFGSALNPHVKPFADISTTPCLVLLGEPGIGKSVALREEYGRSAPGDDDTDGERRVQIDLRSYGSEDRLARDLAGGVPAIEAWIHRGGALDLFLDSLDECLLRVGTLAALLPEVIAGLPVERLRLRIACRTGDWPQTLESGLKRLFGDGGVGVYELTPLRRADVAAAALANGLDPDSFLREVAEREVQAFASRPITLEFLILTRQSRAELPRSRIQLYLQGCRRLAAETSQSRLDGGLGGETSTDQRLELAQRIAAGTIFGNRYAVWTGPETGPVGAEDVTSGELRAVPVGVTTPTAAALGEVLGTGLFTSRGSERLGWSHQTYAEFLAARWAVDTKLELGQIISLITNPHDHERRLVPQLHETAAWVASMQSDVFEALIEHDPEALLRGDVATADPRQRASLAEALLAAYDSERLLDTDRSLYSSYHKLRHSGLSAQLRPFILDAQKGLAVRRMAINVAEACGLTELQDELTRLALDRNQPPLLRKEAASAAAQVADRDHRARLRPLLAANRDEDPDDALRGYALQALWPDHLSPHELFSSLTVPMNPNLYGQYKNFIHQLPDTLSPDALEVGLDWLGQRQPHRHASRDDLEDLGDEILIRVLRGKPRAETLEAVARLLLRNAREYVPLVGGERGRELNAFLSSEPESRRGLLVAALGQMTDQDMVWSLLHSDASLLDRLDLPWLLEWLRSGEGSPTARHAAATAVVRFLFDPCDVSGADRTLRAGLEIAELGEALAPLVAAVELGSERAREMRDAYDRQEAIRRRHEEWMERRSASVSPAPETRVASALARCESGDLDGFWVLTLQLTLADRKEEHANEFEPDLTALPGWKRAEPETHGRILAAAETYLRHRDPNTADWLRSEKWHRPAAAGYKALRLAQRLQPSILATLTVADWVRWAPVIVAYPGMGDKHEQQCRSELIRLAYRVAPDAVLAGLRSRIDRDVQRQESVFGLEFYDEAIDDRLAAFFLESARQPALRGQPFRELLWRAIRHGLPDAVHFARTLLEAPAPEDEDERDRVVTAAALLLQARPGEVWPSVLTLLQRNEDLGRTIALTLADRQYGSILQRLLEDQLASLFVWLARQFRHSEDPHEAEAHFVGPREQVAWFRDEILRELENRGTVAAVRAIESARQELPELEWLKYVVHRARRNTSARTWEAPSVPAILSLGGSRNGHLVRSGSELLDAIVASLGRLEQKLQGETPAARYLWNETRQVFRLKDQVFRPKDEGDLSDFVKLHLEEDLKRQGVIVNREVQIRRRHGGGAGETTDIHVDAVAPDGAGTLDVVTVIVETKGCWNRELHNAMQTQLVERYLRDNRCQHGLYLVGWFDCPQWDAGDYRRADAPQCSRDDEQRALDAQAQDLSGDGLDVRAFVLNAALR